MFFLHGLNSCKKGVALHMNYTGLYTVVIKRWLRNTSLKFGSIRPCLTCRHNTLILADSLFRPGFPNTDTIELRSKFRLTPNYNLAFHFLIALVIIFFSQWVVHSSPLWGLGDALTHDGYEFCVLLSCFLVQ